MKILFVHNFYKVQGGEETVVQNEINMLKNAGHEVKLFAITNESINGFFGKLLVFLETPFSVRSFYKTKRALREFSPDVVHVHNYFPLISPSVFYACSRAGIPVVHTLHNYRAICPTALLMNDGHVNETSVLGSPWWALPHKEYRNSYLGTFALSFMIWLQRQIGTWTSKVDAYICLTEFSKEIYVRAGWPKNKLFLKPNFINDSQITTDFDVEISEPYALYVGRLSDEKGVDLILDAWKGMSMKLVVIGDGPLKTLMSPELGNIVYLGKQPKDKVLGYINNCQFLIMASTWYEGLPMVLIEAFAMRKPALVPKLGGMAEVVLDGVNGVHFTPGSSESLRKHALTLAADPVLCSKMGKSARGIFDSSYSEEVNLRLLTDIYSHVINKSHGIEQE